VIISDVSLAKISVTVIKSF